MLDDDVSTKFDQEGHKSKGMHKSGKSFKE